MSAEEQHVGREPGQWTPVDRFLQLIGLVHARSVAGRKCDEYDPRTVEIGADIVVDCGTCNKVLHRFEGEAGNGGAA